VSGRALIALLEGAAAGKNFGSFWRGDRDDPAEARGTGTKTPEPSVHALR
jgi:hypothetical protein